MLSPIELLSEFDVNSLHERCAMDEGIAARIPLAGHQLPIQRFEQRFSTENFSVKSVFRYSKSNNRDFLAPSTCFAAFVAFNQVV